MTSARFLTVEAVEAVYGDALLALRGVTLAVGEGQVATLLGPNGAGKTTTLKAISGLLASERGRVVAGSIVWRDRPILGRDPVSLVEDGLVQVLEGRHVFPRLTVEQNLVTGAYVRGLSKAEIGEGLDQIYGWFPRLAERRKAKAGLASGGEQQMVAIGRALMTRPTLVLLDEPSMGLAPMIVEEIFGIVRRLNRDRGLTFVIAEQNAAIALRYADVGFVLENGRVVAAAPAAELAARPDVKDIYLGGGATPAWAQGRTAS